MSYGRQSLTQITRASREGYDPSADPEGGKPRFAPGAKVSAQSFSAAGTEPSRVRDISSPKTMSNNLTSLKDSRVGGIFAKGSVKDNWRDDGGLAFKPREAGALGVAGEKESSDFLTQGDTIRSAARIGSKTETASAPDEFSTEPLEERASLLGKPLDASVKSRGFAATLMDPLNPYGSFDRTRKEDFILAPPSEQTDGDGGFARRLEDLVFNGDMSPEDSLRVQKVMLRKFGAEGATI